jgi:putative transposase
MVAAVIRTIFVQPVAAHVHPQFETIATMLGRQLPKVEPMMRAATDDLLAFTGFPVSHWKKIWSTNPLERLNREVKRRTDARQSPSRYAEPDSPQYARGAHAHGHARGTPGG